MESPKSRRFPHRRRNRCLFALCVVALLVWQYLAHSLIWDWQFARLHKMDEDDRRSYLHGVLRNPLTPRAKAAHELFPIANKDSIPLLRGAVRFPPKDAWKVCHWADDYREIPLFLGALTNRDFAHDPEAWDAWWETVKHRSLEEIQRDGFRDAGLPVSDPPNAAFGRALVREALNRENRWIRFNAHRWLFNVFPEDLLEEALRICAASSDKTDRLAALDCMGAIIFSDGSHHREAMPWSPIRRHSAREFAYEQELLSKLADDAEREVRLVALRKLNNNAVLASGFDEDAHILSERTFGSGALEGIQGIFEGPDEAHFLIAYEEDRGGVHDDIWKLACYNYRSDTIDWEYAAKSDLMNRVISGGNPIVIGNGGSHERRLVSLEAQSGEKRWEMDVVAHTDEALPHWKRELRQIEVEDGAIYVTAGASVMRLDGQTGDVLWRTPLGLGERDTPLTALVLLDDIALVASHDRLFALRKDDGAMLWNTQFNDEQESAWPGESDDGARFTPYTDVEGKRGWVGGRTYLRVMCQGDHIYVHTFDHFLHKLDKTGATLARLFLVPEAILDALKQDELQNGAVDTDLRRRSRPGEPASKVPRIHSVRLDAGHIFSLLQFGRSAYLHVYDLDTSSLLWTRTFEDIGFGVTLSLTDDMVIAAFSRESPKHGEGIALDKRTGKEIWAVESRFSRRFEHVYPRGENLIMIGDRRRLELRNSGSGKVVLVYRRPHLDDHHMLVRGDVVVGEGAAAREGEDRFWVLRIPEGF